MKTLNNFNKTLLNSINFKIILCSIALVCFTQIGFGQTTIFNESGGGSEPSGWTFENNVTSQLIDKGSYWLVQDGTTNDFIITAFYDLSAYTSAEFSLDVATYGGGTNNPAKIEFSTDNGNTYTQTEISNTPPSSSYINGGAFTLNNLSSQVVIRISSNGTTGKDVRLRNLELIATGSSGLPGITLSEVSGNTTEAGDTATFTAVLNVAPTSDVVLNVTSGDTGEVTVTPSQLTFTSSNWDTSQTITVSGVDDATEDGNQDVAITVAVDDALSDAAYAGLSETTTVTNEDNDLPSGSIPYSEDFSDCGTQNWTVFTVGAQQEWTCDGDGYFEANAFGSSGAADDYLVSPEFNMDGQSGETLSFTSWTQYTDTTYPRIELLYTTNFTGDVSTTTWNSSLSPTFSPEDSQAETESGDVDISGLTGTSVVFAFRYTSSGTGGGSTSKWRVDNINIAIPVTWQGDDPTTPNDWSTAANWSTGAVPTSSDIVFIDGTFTNEPTISSTDAVAQSVTVASGNTLTIDESSSLTVSGDFTNDGTVTLNSTADDFSSLIVTGTATGDITYNRFVNSYNDGFGGGWDLVGSPTVMTITDFTTANGANIEVLGSDYAFSQYDNAIGDWIRYETASQTGSFTTGQGYSMATVEVSPPPPGAAGATVAFTGAMQTTSQSINVINNNGLNGVGRRWNLVSNPFPSYINGNTAAGATNFIDTNLAVIDGNYGAVYGWNGSSYTIYNLLDGAFSIAPGQGFWIAAASESEVALDFTAAMRTTTGSGDFVTGPQPLTYYVGLKLYNGETQKAATKFYFRDGLSLGLDTGYDAGAFNQSTKLSTRLPGGSQETAFARNAMGMDAMQNTRVPLEIRQNVGQAFTISIADMELPEDIYVYLEDTLNGTLTSLKDQDFELTAQSDLSGVDRFFIVFKSNSVLSNGDTLGINALNVYKANTDSFVTIAGISPELGKLNVSLYNILGQTVREKALSSATATQRVSTQGLASGFYIVQIRSGNQTTVKKIIVK